MLQILISILAFLLVITVLVAVHEFGHFWVAKINNVKVERFSIGFGKPFYRRMFNKKETEFAVAPYPLGGYVKMMDSRFDDLSDADLPRAYDQKTPWQRIAILLAGPFANLFFAVLIFWLLFVYGVSAFKPILNPNHDSIAFHAGLKSGDTVIAVNNKEVSSFEEFMTKLFKEIITLNDNNINEKIIQLRVQNIDSNARSRLVTLPINGDMLRLENVDQIMQGLGLQIWRPHLQPVIDKVSSNSSASLAGLRSGDRVTAINDVKIDTWDELLQIIQAKPNESVEIEFERSGNSFKKLINVAERQSEGQTIGIIGVSVQVPENYGSELQTKQRYPVLQALQRSLDKTWEMCVLSLQMFKEMIKGNVSLKNLSGPVTIAEQAGYSVQSGLDRYIAFFALISIALGIVNLLPVPMLDGGQIVLNIVELFKGSQVSQRVELIYQQLGVLCIILLMGLALFNDFERLLT